MVPVHAPPVHSLSIAISKLNLVCRGGHKAGGARGKKNGQGRAPAPANGQGPGAGELLGRRAAASASRLSLASQPSLLTSQKGKTRNQAPMTDPMVTGMKLFQKALRKFTRLSMYEPPTMMPPG